MLLAAAGVGLAGWHLGRLSPTAAPRALSPVPYEAWARREFVRRYPGEKPLNWRLAETAVRLHRERPMGRFVLGVEPGVWGNDCSDFLDCVVDEALGVGARCFRGGRNHRIGTDPRYFHYFYWDGREPLQPGDLISVRHSPWYDPDPDAAWHVGMLGPDGRVYDFVKLRRWSEARYGRNPLGWFLRYSRGPKEVLVGRLRPQYRYRLEPIPVSPDSSS
jgi:hypothetical protein